MAGCMTAISLCTACSDDDGPTLRPTLPGNEGGILKKVEHLGGVTSTYDWEFTYDDGRLTKAVGQLRDPYADIDMSYSYTCRLGYGDRRVTVSSSGDKSIAVTLNGSGYIEKMTVDRDIYQFYYMDGRLKGWEKTIFENNFGGVMQYRSSATIEYKDGDLSTITYTETGNPPVVLTLTPTTIPNRNGLLPETIGKELGVLGYEHLYYAGLLGRPTTHLVGQIDIAYPTLPEKNSSTTFEYNNKNGNTVLCNYHTPAGEVASVKYTY